MYKKTTKASAIYHIKDDIKYFQFNLYFRQISSLLNLPTFDVKAGASKDKLSNDKDIIQVITIKWQEKLFSAHEIEFYSDINNCFTDAQKTYHKLILESEPQNLLRNEPIFTYIDEDNFTPESEGLLSEHTPRKAHREDDEVVLMYVYAAISPNTVLVSLRWQPSDKVLHIYPDFNNFRENPYLIEIDSDYRHLYAYGIENSSKQSRKRRDVDIFAELQLPEIPHWEDIDELATKFAMPPKRCQQNVILLNIGRAEGFDYDDIHVRYHIRLPERTILEEGLLSACTHTSRANSDGVCRFGHCLEIVLLCEEDFKLENLCHLYFEVISIDSWERERLEGYSHLSFILEKGSENKLLQCHRPVQGGILEKLNRYFIGGRRKFDFERFYVGDAVFSNRYGTTMVTTGSLLIRYEVLSQRNPELLRPTKNRLTGMPLEDIMKAYREASRRLKAAARE